MDGWMDGWMDRQMMDRGMDGWLNEWLYRQIDEHMNIHVHVHIMMFLLIFSDIVDLIQFCSLSSLSSSAVSEGMKLLVKILKQSDENPQDHLTILCAQVNITA